MANTNSKTKLTYAFSFGFVGGPMHARQFIQRMNKAGFVHTANTQKADIIIAHSAGTWLIPKDAQPKLVVYVGMPLAQDDPNQTRRTAVKYSETKKNKKLQMQYRYYFVRKLKRNLKIIRMARTATPTVFNNVPAVFIANQDDPWPIDKRLDEIIERESWSFIGLPGSHDNIWVAPEAYLEIINHYARLLV